MSAVSANPQTSVSNSCNDWKCCFWCCKSDDAVEPVRPAPPPTPQPAQLVHSVAMRSISDLGQQGVTDFQFDAVHMTMHHTPQITPEHSEHDE